MLGDDGKPCPSRLADADEVRALAAALREFDRGLIEIAPRTVIGSVDDKSAEQQFFGELARESGKTVVLITHSIPEAVFLGDRVVVMSPRPGRITTIVDVPIPRPRSIDVMGEPMFGQLTSRIRRLLYGMDSGRAAVTVAGGGLG